MARHESNQLLVLCNLIATTVLIVLKFETSVALERPYHLTIYVLSLSGLVCFALGRCSSSNKLVPARESDSENDNDQSEQQFLVEDQPYASISRARRTFTYALRSYRTAKQSSIALVASLVLRALVLRNVIHSVECSWQGVEHVLPIFLCLLELLTNGYRQLLTPRSKGGFQSSWFFSLRYALLTALWSISAYGTIQLSRDHSTYICPEANHMRRWISTLQVIGTILDAVSLSLLSYIMRESYDCGRPPWKRLGRLALMSVTIMLTVACFFLWWTSRAIYTRHYVLWVILPDTKTFLEVAFAALLGTNFVISALYLLAELRATTVVVTTSSIGLYVYQIVHPISEYSTVPGRIPSILCLAAFTAAFGIVRIERDASKAQQLFSMSQKCSRCLLLLYGLLGLAFWNEQFQLLSSTGSSATHPITALISSASSTAFNWEKQASMSTSLGQAVDEYQARYRIPPPPHFDKWWNYAKSRDSVVKDAFDQISEDLLPFWGLKPSDIRDLTAHMIERPWTQVAGLQISNGTTALGLHMPPTHRWMVDGAADMINKFAEWLPDMNLAFNINDESRVAVPWQDMERLKAQAAISRLKLNQTKTLRGFSKDLEWSNRFMESEPPYPWDQPSPYFHDASFKSSFMGHGVTGCPPDSPGQKQTRWMKDTICLECAQPHSIGPFVANWTLSGSLCHQPDLAHLHGFHLSPSAFRPTKKPFPVFSQSKIPNFNDILFPSPWNYRDKVAYNSTSDMPYAEKEQTVFWRGAPSEGYAIHGSWQGMQRQRFVHMANYIAADSSVNVLVPGRGDKMGYTRQPTPVEQITSMTNFSVSFVGEPTRCDESACAIQSREFDFGSSVDFQNHWKYKFLFDLDGAGFSGRFLPFLESRSLVLRAAGFRQWFEERLVAWRHFVPVDGRLHGVWHLIAYFGGTHEGNGHEREAEAIAEQGRAWAARVLRKEDMEIYMFRLLLEWARIIDDRREELGFVLE